MTYNNFSIVDCSIVRYQKSEDEDKAIQKLAEHRDMKLMVKEIGEALKNGSVVPGAELVVKKNIQLK